MPASDSSSKCVPSGTLYTRSDFFVSMIGGADIECVYSKRPHARTPNDQRQANMHTCLQTCIQTCIYTHAYSLRPQKPQVSPRWPQNGPQSVRQSLSKSGGHMFGSPYLAILGPPGPSWAHLGPLSQPSCHPTSPLGTSMAELRLPKPHLLRSDSQSCKLC